MFYIKNTAINYQKCRKTSQTQTKYFHIKPLILGRIALIYSYGISKAAPTEYEDMNMINRQHNRMTEYRPQRKPKMLGVLKQMIEMTNRVITVA